MRKVFHEGRFVFIPLAAAAFLSLISFAVMQLWNNLLPAILHVGVVTFWQAMGLFILCKLLFGFGRGGRGGMGAPWMRRGMENKFRSMTPEQRERFKQHMRNRNCGPRNKWKDFDWETEDTTLKETPDMEGN